MNCPLTRTSSPLSSRLYCRHPEDRKVHAWNNHHLPIHHETAPYLDTFVSHSYCLSISSEQLLLTPQIIIRQLKNHRQQFQQSPVHGIDKILMVVSLISLSSIVIYAHITKRSNLIHKRKNTPWNTIEIFEFRRIEVKLLNPIILSLLALQIAISVPNHLQEGFDILPSTQTSA